MFRVGQKSRLMRVMVNCLKTLAGSEPPMKKPKNLFAVEEFVERRSELRQKEQQAHDKWCREKFGACAREQEAKAAAETAEFVAKTNAKEKKRRDDRLRAFDKNLHVMSKEEAALVFEEPTDPFQKGRILKIHPFWV